MNAAECRLKAWAKRRKVTKNEALEELLDIAEGRDILGVLSGLKERYRQGMTASELAQLDVLYSWLGYVFEYRAPH